VRPLKVILNTNVSNSLEFWAIREWRALRKFLLCPCVKMALGKAGNGVKSNNKYVVNYINIFQAAFAPIFLRRYSCTDILAPKNFKAKL
jgi:hypothetical protein